MSPSHCVVRWYVLDAETTDLVAIHTDGNEQLSVMRFSRGEFSRPVTLDSGCLGEPVSHNPLLSADGALLAVGSHDNFIYLYTVSETGRKYSRYGKCTVSNSTCAMFRFSSWAASSNRTVWLSVSNVSTGSLQLHHSPGLVT